MDKKDLIQILKSEKENIMNGNSGKKLEDVEKNKLKYIEEFIIFLNETEEFESCKQSIHDYELDIFIKTPREDKIQNSPTYINGKLEFYKKQLKTELTGNWKAIYTSKQKIYTKKLEIVTRTEKEINEIKNKILKLENKNEIIERIPNEEKKNDANIVFEYIDTMKEKTIETLLKVKNKDLENSVIKYLEEAKKEIEEKIKK